MPIGRPKSSGSSNSEQWEIINPAKIFAAHKGHEWKIVALRNGHGTIKHGLQCLDCGAVEMFNQREFRSHGQRVERSEK